MKRIAIVTLLSAFAAAPVFAADQGAYVAVDLGQVSFSGDTEAQLSVGGTRGTFPNPHALRIGGGYHFSQYLGVEGGYSIIQDSTVSTSGTVAGNPATGTETVKTSSLQVAAVGTYPINDMFAVFGKLGLANDKLDYSCGVNVAGAVCPLASASGSKTNLIFGLGGQYNINQRFGIRAQYEDFGKVSAAGNSIGLKVVSVGGVFNF